METSCWEGRIREAGGYLNNLNDQKYTIPGNITAEPKVLPASPLATCLLRGPYGQRS